MKKRWPLLMIVTALCLALSLGAVTAEAANKTMWDVKGITWDLTPGNTVTYYSYMGGGGYVKQKAKLTCISTEWADANHNYIKMSLKVDFKRTIKPSAAKIQKIADYYNAHKDLPCAPRCYVAVVDEDSGKCLMNANNKNVQVSKISWTSTGSKTYQSGGRKLTLTNARATFNVVFPKSYTGMCIGIGGWTSIKQSSNDQRFWAGEIPFWKDTGKYSTKKSGVAHFVNTSING